MAIFGDLYDVMRGGEHGELKSHHRCDFQSLVILFAKRKIEEKNAK